MNFEIRIIDLHWIDGSLDNPNDFCLHGKVFVKIDNMILTDGVEWTVSAGAYRMLESLYSNHEIDKGEHFLPCCGHFMFVDDKIDKLSISGCPNGIDWSVFHENGMVKLVPNEGIFVIIPFEAYKHMIFSFADSIKAFYDKCSPKLFTEDFEEKAYQRFWHDWEKLRNGNPSI